MLILASFLLAAHVPFSYSPRMLFGSSLYGFMQLPDFVLMLAILAFGVRERSRDAFSPIYLELTWIRGTRPERN
jgi:hypothetical protein